MTAIRYDWTKPVLDLCQRLIAAGCALVEVDDGGDIGEEIRVSHLPPHIAQLAATEAIVAVDDSTLVIKCPDGKSRLIFIVLGNSCEELVSDYSTGCAAMETPSRNIPPPGRASRHRRRRLPSKSQSAGGSTPPAITTN